jgi:hypothetical protein
MDCSTSAQNLPRLTAALAQAKQALHGRGFVAGRLKLHD